MEKKILERFLGKKVKLVIGNNFALYGTVEEVFDDCILFKTRTQESIISFSDIKNIVGGDY